MRHWSEITFLSGADPKDLPIEVRIYDTPDFMGDLVIGNITDARAIFVFDDHLDGIERFGQRIIDAAKAVREKRSIAVPILDGERRLPAEVRMEELLAERQTWIDARFPGAVDGVKLWAAEFPDKNAELVNLLPF